MSVNVNRKDFINSIIDNDKLMSATMQQWCIGEKGKKVPNSLERFYTTTMNDSVLFYIIRYGGISVEEKVSLLNSLKTFTDDKEVLNNIQQYENNKKEVDKAICGGQVPEFIFNMYWGNKFETVKYLNHLHDWYEGTFTSFDEAVKFIKACSKDLSKDDNEAADNTIHIVTKDKLLDSTASSNDLLRYGFITLNGFGEVLSVNASHEWIKLNHPFNELGKSSITFHHPFKPTMVVKPLYCELNEPIMNNSYICFVRRMNCNDIDRDGFGIYITVYDRDNKGFYDLPGRMNPFMFDIMSDCMYADDANLYDFIKKYQDNNKFQDRQYTLTDLLNAAIDLKG